MPDAPRQKLVVIDVPELVALVHDAVVEALASTSIGSDDPIPLKKCGAPVRSLRRAIEAGELTAVRVGRELRVRRSDLNAWLESRRVKPGEKSLMKPALSPAERAVERARLSGALRVVSG